ncbi:MAG: hypothetical protein LUH53_01580, partial [Lachnospiraceae bacterium]|nr:hypothetical protein [Lachnospiraceae bacterium]
MKNNVRNVLKGFVTAVICVMISGMLCPEASFAASEKTLPDPNDYFDGVCVGWTEDMEEISDIDIAYISDTDLQDAVDAYEAVLISDYSFEFEYYDDRGRGTGPVLAYKGNEEDGKITFWYFGYVEDDVTGMGSGYFVVLIYENVSGFSWISGNKSGGVPEADGAILPDVGIFLNCERGE